jgi:hypothetical protein
MPVAVGFMAQATHPPELAGVAMVVGPVEVGSELSEVQAMSVKVGVSDLRRVLAPRPLSDPSIVHFHFQTWVFRYGMLSTMKERRR